MRNDGEKILNEGLRVKQTSTEEIKTFHSSMFVMLLFLSLTCAQTARHPQSTKRSRTGAKEENKKNRGWSNRGQKPPHPHFGSNVFSLSHEN